MATNYEIRIRHLEAIVYSLLARTEPAWFLDISSTPSTGSFRYSLDHGLVPLLSEAATKSLAMAQSIHIPPFQRPLSLQIHQTTHNPLDQPSNQPSTNPLPTSAAFSSMDPPPSQRRINRFNPQATSLHANPSKTSPDFIAATLPNIPEPSTIKPSATDPPFRPELVAMTSLDPVVAEPEQLTPPRALSSRIDPPRSTRLNPKPPIHLSHPRVASTGPPTAVVVIPNESAVALTDLPDHRTDLPYPSGLTLPPPIDRFGPQDGKRRQGTHPAFTTDHSPPVRPSDPIPSPLSASLPFVVPAPPRPNRDQTGQPSLSSPSIRSRSEPPGLVRREPALTAFRPSSAVGRPASERSVHTHSRPSPRVPIPAPLAHPSVAPRPNVPSIPHLPVASRPEITPPELSISPEQSQRDLPPTDPPVLPHPSVAKRPNVPPVPHPTVASRLNVLPPPPPSFAGRTTPVLPPCGPSHPLSTGLPTEPTSLPPVSTGLPMPLSNLPPLATALPSVPSDLPGLSPALPTVMVPAPDPHMAPTDLTGAATTSMAAPPMDYLPPASNKDAAPHPHTASTAEMAANPYHRQLVSISAADTMSGYDDCLAPLLYQRDFDNYTDLEEYLALLKANDSEDEAPSVRPSPSTQTVEQPHNHAITPPHIIAFHDQGSSSFSPATPVRHEIAAIGSLAVVDDADVSDDHFAPPLTQQDFDDYNDLQEYLMLLKRNGDTDGDKKTKKKKKKKKKKSASTVAPDEPSLPIADQSDSNP